MKKVGLIGWRGMVGSVLMERMKLEGDFEKIQPFFFSTSQKGEAGPNFKGECILEDAYDLKRLKEMDVIITCQGGDYTNEIYPKLMEQNFKGYWIDASSSLRLDDSSTLILDPINGKDLEVAIGKGKKLFVGANCTVSLMLLGIGGLFKHGLVEWVSSMTYQAASGAGAKNMRELLFQMKGLGDISLDLFKNPNQNMLEIEKLVSEKMNSEFFPTSLFGAPLAGSLLPWIDAEMDNGQSKEEWKAMFETNKILGTKGIAVDGTCVRVGAMRCHSQGLTIKLNKNIDISEVQDIIAETSDWTDFVPNSKEQTIARLTPANVSGKLKVSVGRVRKMNIGDNYLNAFSVGDQLLWGAAEPLRRILGYLR